LLPLAFYFGEVVEVEEAYKIREKGFEPEAWSLPSQDRQREQSVLCLLRAQKEKDQVQM
jgi:hypothetical protein